MKTIEQLRRANRAAELRTQAAQRWYRYAPAAVQQVAAEAVRECQEGERVARWELVAAEVAGDEYVEVIPFHGAIDCPEVCYG